jgi:hypothetical protein
MRLPDGSNLANDTKRGTKPQTRHGVVLLFVLILSPRAFRVHGHSGHSRRRRDAIHADLACCRRPESCPRRSYSLGSKRREMEDRGAFSRTATGSGRQRWRRRQPVNADVTACRYYIYIYIYIYAHTHTHIHTYTYITCQVGCVTARRSAAAFLRT